MSDLRAIIIANGDLQNLATARALIQPSDHLIAADGGTRHYRALGLIPHVLIGDLDSTSPADLARLEAAGTQIIRYPVRKDQTDLELALLWAIANGASEIIVLGALGGRWDQTLANLLLPALPAFADVAIRLVDGDQHILTLRGPGLITLPGAPGDTVSLIPVGGAVYGITTLGMEYPLVNGTLEFGSTLGVSNVILTQPAQIEIQDGLLVCIVISVQEQP